MAKSQSGGNTYLPLSSLPSTGYAVPLVWKFEALSNKNLSNHLVRWRPMAGMRWCICWSTLAVFFAGCVTDHLTDLPNGQKWHQLFSGATKVQDDWPTDLK